MTIVSRSMSTFGIQEHDSTLHPLLSQPAHMCYTTGLAHEDIAPLRTLHPSIGGGEHVAAEALEGRGKERGGGEGVMKGETYRENTAINFLIGKKGTGIFPQR